MPAEWPPGQEHDQDWLVRHRWVAADDAQSCTSCHRERDCVDCHDGRVRPTQIHPNDYLTIHPQQARRNEPDCASCHNEQRFCQECHARLGLAQIAAPAARASARFHPPADVWISGPNLHGQEAMRAMNTCVSCHAQRDCVSCHGALGIGGGFSPHPANFSSQCAGLLRRNPRACQTCHGDLGALQALCR